MGHENHATAFEQVFFYTFTIRNHKSCKIITSCNSNVLLFIALKAASRHLRATVINTHSPTLDHCESGLRKH
jgi:hypothetical protein